MEAEAEAGAVMVSEMVTEVEEPVRAEGGASLAVVTAVGATAAEGWRWRRWQRWRRRWRLWRWW